MAANETVENIQPEKDGWEKCDTYQKVPEVYLFKVEDKAKGTVDKYMLKEWGSDEVENYLKNTAIRMGAGKRRPRPEDADFEDFQVATIATRCYRQDGTTKVPISEIRTWPASTIGGLFDKTMTMNGLNEDGKDAAKKS